MSAQNQIASDGTQLWVKDHIVVAHQLPDENISFMSLHEFRLVMRYGNHVVAVTENAINKSRQESKQNG